MNIKKELQQRLFDLKKPGIFTSISGMSHATYVQHTAGSRHVHAQMLAIFDRFDLEYYLFAGTMVGYVRDGSVPDWMDDLDIMVFEDQIEKFETEVLPYLISAGFNCFAPGAPFEKGGYHILGLQTADWDREVTIPLAEDMDVKVPWAQIDVFYATVDEDGFVRSPAKFGLFHKKDIPEDWVKPGTFVQIEGGSRRVFSKYAEDIAKEYGDVQNNTVVATHHEVFLTMENTPWPLVRSAFDQIVHETTSALPLNANMAMMQQYSPEKDNVAHIGSGESFDTITVRILRLHAARVMLTDDDQIFWVMDLKRLFPTLLVEVSPKSMRGARRAAHLHTFIDHVSCADEEIQEEYYKCVNALARTVYPYGRLIAHAGGGDESTKYSNSLEALKTAAEKVSLIELDICEVADGLIVAHEGLEARYGLKGKFPEVTVAQFASTKFDGKLTPMTLPVLMEQLKDKPVRVICDIKTFTPGAYATALEEIMRQADAQGVRDQVIVQVYTPEDYDDAMRIGFKHFILALWKSYGSVWKPEGMACIDYCFDGSHDGFRALSVDKVHFLEKGKWVGDEVAAYVRSKSPMVFIHGQPPEAEELLMRKGFGLFTHHPEKLFWLVK